ncbi:hypothetical protein CPTD_00657 [Corynebacterium pseudotuberculosis]|nr:Hypothetical protein BFF96_0370 [Corynebacterium pseudotuberculosis]AUY59754.1 Hypothetical protein BFG00_0366 [Corynebacterium pseudotuberculosis]KEX88919.1 hypothetical protein CPTD_00657 [Corynebacterium pseudotuberculosis]
MHCTQISQGSFRFPHSRFRSEVHPEGVMFASPAVIQNFYIY